MVKLRWLVLCPLLAGLAALAGGGYGGQREAPADVPQANPWRGCYRGTYTGSDQGTWEARVNRRGHLTGTAESPGLGTCNVVGTVTAAGRLRASGSGTGEIGPYTVKWTGRFQVSEDTGNIRCHGQWSVDGSSYSGTWRGRKVRCE